MMIIYRVFDPMVVVSYGGYPDKTAKTGTVKHCDSVSGDDAAIPVWKKSSW